MCIRDSISCVQNDICRNTTGEVCIVTRYSVPSYLKFRTRENAYLIRVFTRSSPVVSAKMRVYHGYNDSTRCLETSFVYHLLRAITNPWVRSVCAVILLQTFVQWPTNVSQHIGLSRELSRISFRWQLTEITFRITLFVFSVISVPIFTFLIWILKYYDSPSFLFSLVWFPTQLNTVRLCLLFSCLTICFIFW